MYITCDNVAKQKKSPDIGRYMNLLFFTSRMWEFDDLTGNDRKLLGHARLRVLETHDFFLIWQKICKWPFLKEIEFKKLPICDLHLLPT